MAEERETSSIRVCNGFREAEFMPQADFIVEPASNVPGFFVIILLSYIFMLSFTS